MIYSSTCWMGYKRVSRKKDSKGSDQTYNIPEYEIPGSIQDDLHHALV